MSRSNLRCLPCPPLLWSIRIGNRGTQLTPKQSCEHLSSSRRNSGLQTQESELDSISKQEKLQSKFTQVKLCRLPTKLVPLHVMRDHNTCVPIEPSQAYICSERTTCMYANGLNCMHARGERARNSVTKKWKAEFQKVACMEMIRAYAGKRVCTVLAQQCGVYQENITHAAP